MGLKEVIKEIVSIFFPPTEINNSGEYRVSFLSSNKLVEINQITNNNYTINIDPTKLNDEQKNKLIEIYPEIRENNGLILEKKEFEIFKEQREKNKDIPILKFFKGKIKEEDYQALRISVYIQRKFSEGEDIKKHLDDLYKKYGRRGHNISNLYGRGYFDNFIKLNYTILQSHGKEDEFLTFFDKFVMEQPITYFVNSTKSQESTNNDLFSKIDRCKRYGIKRLSIHGIGKINKEKINKFTEIIDRRTDVKIISRIDIETTFSLILEISNE
ncbi:MAG: hypothetical protein ABIH28_03315 [archaeon]